jgi:putative transposase
MWTPAGYRKLVKHFDNGEPHFLTFSCHDRLPLLSKDRTRLWLTEALDAARRKHGFHLWAWVIMPEHVHLLIWPPAAEIAASFRSTRGKTKGILADIKRPVAQKAIRYLKQHSPEYLERLTIRNRRRTYRRFWLAGSAYDENVCETSALHEICEYIHNNPVRRGLVARAEDWLWSSAREWSNLAGDVLCRVDRTIPPALEIPWISQRGRS